MKSFKRFRIGMILLVFITAALQVWPITLKIGSAVPKGSPWERAMVELSREWKDISGGRVNLRLYLGGAAGSDSDMVRKMQINQLQGAALSSLGLNSVSQELISLNLPFLFNDEEEVEYVLEEMDEYFTVLLADKGFVPIAWTVQGWVYFFAKQPIASPQDLQEQKLSVTADNAEFLQVWKNMGFNAFPLPGVEVMTGLQSGMVEAFYAPPLMAASYQWFAIADNMYELKISPLIGLFVVTERAWDRIPDDLKPDLIRSARRAMAPLNEEINEINARAVKVMKDNGLEINPVEEEDRRTWEEVFTQGVSSAVGNLFSRNIYSTILEHRDEYRQNN